MLTNAPVLPSLAAAGPREPLVAAANHAVLNPGIGGTRHEVAGAVTIRYEAFGGCFGEAAGHGGLDLLDGEGRGRGGLSVDATVADICPAPWA